MLKPGIFYAPLLFINMNVFLSVVPLLENYLSKQNSL